MTIKERQAMDTKKKILDSARELISRDGYDQVSVNQIVAHCGIAKGTFYHHFKSKEEMMLAMSESVYEKLSVEPEQIQGKPFLERFYWFITSWHRNMQIYNLHFARENLKQYASAVDLGEYGGNISRIEEGLALVLRYLKDAQAAGEVSADAPTEVLAKAIIFSLQGSTLYHCKHGSDFDVMAWNEEYISYILDPLLKPYLSGGTPDSEV